MIYKGHLSVVTFVGTLLMSAFSFEDSHGWQESARFCRERAMTLQRNGFQICQKYAFLDGGVFRGATNFRKDAYLEDFGWVSFTNERNGTVVSAGFSGTNLSILSSIRTSGERRVSSWYFSKGHMWHASDEISNICFGVRFYLNGGVRETATCVDTEKGLKYLGSIYFFDQSGNATSSRDVDGKFEKDIPFSLERLLEKRLLER